MAESLITLFERDLTIKRATLTDSPDVFALLDGAARWLHAHNKQGWPAGDFTLENVRREVSRYDFYIARFEAEAVGTLALFLKLPPFDQQLWGDVPDDALYVHRLAVSRAYRGQQIGQILLDWAGQMARQAGKTYLRLDCGADNEPLCNYYIRAGFQFKGRWEEGRIPLARFEKKL